MGAGNSTELVFPKGFPLGCPPEDAASADGVVYRIIKTNPLSPSDFLSAQEMGKPVPANRKCEGAGLSVFRDKRDAVLCRDKYPRLGERIAEGVLTNEHGKLKPSPRGRNSHTTWWPYEGVVRYEPFKMVEEQ